MGAFAVFKDAWQNRHKLGDNKHSHELAAFLPAALEIQETPPNPLVRWIAWTLLALVFIAILWACFGHVNIVVTAEGKIIPSSRVKQIQPLENGIVKAILVNEGDPVTQGQALIELDPTRTTADKNRLQSELHTTRLDIAVSQALLSQIEATATIKAEKQQSLQPDQLVLNLPASANPQETQLYQHLLWQQWQQYWSQYQSLQSSLRRTQAEKATSEEISSKLTQVLPIVSKRASSLEKLHKKDFISEADYMQAEQERIEAQQDLAAEKQRQQQLKAGISEVRQQINTHIAENSSILLAQISDQQRQISALQEELIKANDLNDKQILYAPVAGRVQELVSNTVGGVVTTAQQLMIIVPAEEQLEAQVFVANKDIGFVHEAMSSEIKIHTFPFTKYGLINAQVSNISNDAIVDEQRGLIYSMHLRLSQNTIMVKGKEMNLLPGMAVTAEMKTGKRRIIEFFLSPLLRARSEAIRER